MQENKELEQKPKHRDKIEALDNLSLGISIVAAIVIGFGIAMVIKPVVDFISRFLKGRRKVVSFVIILIFFMC